MRDASSASMPKPMDLNDAAGPGKIAEDLSQPKDQSAMSFRRVKATSIVMSPNHCPWWLLRGAESYRCRCRCRASSSGIRQGRWAMERLMFYGHMQRTSAGASGSEAVKALTEPGPRQGESMPYNAVSQVRDLRTTVRFGAVLRCDAAGGGLAVTVRRAVVPGKPIP
ncbi:hypothetical protein CKAH01_02778 [Colletotrichum kahawae]|uniref:Uncharacterized protein n=1 Tax=Colletotrichum kahawae TaxID=34407 RepID=A0AAD9XY81_COLKA|nr:hypothetical protein CKAH01_02778 [Colletotrichum kahawae]